MGWFSKPLLEPPEHRPGKGKAKMKGTSKSGSSSYHGKGYTPLKKKGK